MTENKCNDCIYQGSCSYLGIEPEKLPCTDFINISEYYENEEDVVDKKDSICKILGEYYNKGF